VDKDNTTRQKSEVGSTIFHRFCAADYDSVLNFFSTRQVFEIIGLSSVFTAIYKSSDVES
jgi:hypothetical protein